MRLALSQRAGLLTAIRVPSEQEEAVRDLVRTRADLAGDRKRMMQRIGALLQRHGRVWRAPRWTYQHRAWPGAAVVRRADTLGHAEFLQVLCEDELARRDAAKVTRRIRAARFPAADATLESFDWGYNPKLPAAAMRDLARLEFLTAGEGIIAHGPGVGKSHLAAALGHQACRRGYDVAFTTCSRLLAHLVGGHADRSFEVRVRKLAKVTVLICDDFAMREFTAAQADDLYELLTSGSATRGGR